MGSYFDEDWFDDDLDYDDFDYDDEDDRLESTLHGNYNGDYPWGYDEYDDDEYDDEDDY